MLHTKTKYLIFILVMVPFSGIGIDLYAPALPNIAHSFNSDTHYVQITIAIYLLGLGLAQPLFGSLSDNYGRKPILLCGLCLYALFSLSIFLAYTINELILLRLLQGCCAASVSVCSKSMVSDVFHNNETAMKSVTSKMGVAYGIGPIIAPVIGAYLLQLFGWRSNFLFLFIISLILLINIVLFLPESLPVKARKLYTSKNSLKIYRVIFVRHFFISAIICMAIVFAFDGIFHILAPFIVQNYLNYSPVIYGYLAFTLGFAYFFGCIFNNFLVKRLSMSRIINIGFLLLAIATVVLTGLFYLNIINLIVLTTNIFVVFLSGGLIIPNCMSLCLNEFPENAGAASAVIGFLMIIFTGVILLLVSLLSYNPVLAMPTWILALSILCFILYKYSVEKGASL